MATAVTAPRKVNLYDPERLLTIADVAVLPSQLPSGPVQYELNDGRLVVMAPPGADHGKSQIRFGFELIRQGVQPGHGEAYSETGVILRRNPDRLVGPDAAFIVTSRMPARISREGYLETVPDLVVEIRSKNDKPSEVEEKIEDYLRAGVRVVWVGDPEVMTVTEHRSKHSPRVFTADDTLIVEDVIPGFAMKVRDGFC